MKTKFALSFLLLFLLVSCDLENDGVYLENYSYGDPDGDISGEQYNEIIENPFVLVADEPVSTFSIDADGAAYSNTRRFLTEENSLPPRNAVRTEELVNYFNYNYADPTDEHPIALNGEISSCPWTPGHRLIRIGIKGQSIPQAELPPSNIVLLIDVSGSMNPENKLPLLKESLELFVDQLDGQDRIAIVTYAGASGLILGSTAGSEKETIKEAIRSLRSAGSTAGADGINTAYEVAQQNFIEGGNNRVILATDGDFNVGISSQEELVSLIEQKRDLGIFLTVLGLGRGNLQDGKMEQLADNGNGNYEYIDNLDQAKKVFIHEYSKFYTVAKDVKIQVDFNPNIVEAYRLIGYENRVLENEDFEDDEEDAGEIGAGQCITAFYEIIPAEGGDSFSAPSFTIDFRYKLPDEDMSIPMMLNITDEGKAFAQASEDMRFAVSVAGFGLLLIESEYIGDFTFEDVLNGSSGAMSYDPFGWKAEFQELVGIAKDLE